MASVTKISSNLWFDNEAEDAANFYVSVFKNAKIIRTTRYSNVGFEIHKRPEGSVMTVEFDLDGSNFVALNGGPVFTFNEAVSFIVNCETQDEINYYWDKLSEGGDKKAQECGWLKDKFGLSWQIVPKMINELFIDYTSEKSQRAMQAMLHMKKLDIAALQQAYDGQ